MSLESFRSLILGILIAVLLDGTATRLLRPTPAFAQNGSDNPVYIEPGVSMLRAADGSRQVLGKVIVDLRNGNVWGFPTTTNQPYPVNVTSQQPPTSKPFLLGRFDLGAMHRE